MLGLLLRNALPDDHRNAESKEPVRLAIGLVATMSAMVLGPLVSSAKSFYDAQSAEVAEISAKFVLLDRILAHCGPEAKEPRDVLRVVLVDTLDRVWPQERTRTGKLEPIHADIVADKIQAPSPADDNQRWVKAQALTLAIAIGKPAG